MKGQRTANAAPNLLLIGKDESVDAVAPALRELRARVRQRPGLEGLEAWWRQDYLAVILADLEGSARPWRDVGTLRELTSTPLFAVLSDDSSTTQIRRCYDAGASGVFEWPREAELLDRYLAEMLSIRLVRGPAQRPETALARAVRTRLRVLPGLDEIPRLEVRWGIVRASGTVESLPVKWEVGECIASVPGVKGVDTGALHVIPDPGPDQQIRQTCRRLVRSSSRVEEKTVSIDVDRGQVTFRGSARDRRELGRLLVLAANIRGVRDVRLDVVTSKEREERDRRAAKRLAKIVEEVFPEEQISLAFFGRVAVLSGKVRTLRARRTVEEFLAGGPLIERVVNKLEVTG